MDAIWKLRVKGDLSSGLLKEAFHKLQQPSLSISALSILRLFSQWCIVSAAGGILVSQLGIKSKPPAVEVQNLNL